MKFSIKDFFSKCDIIRSFLQIWSNLLNKSLMENFIFCAVILALEQYLEFDPGFEFTDIYHCFNHHFECSSNIYIIFLCVVKITSACWCFLINRMVALKKTFLRFTAITNICTSYNFRFLSYANFTVNVTPSDFSGRLTHLSMFYLAVRRI